MSTKWKWLTDETWHWKGHVVSEDLVHPIEGELYDRGVADDAAPTFLIVDQTDEVCFDLPGMMMTTRKLRTIDLNGLNLVIPSADFESILAQVRLLELREVVAGDEKLPYYKLHGWRFCIVLSPTERTTLITAMEAQLAEVEVEAEDDRRRFAEGLKGIPGLVSARAHAYENKGNN